MLETKTNDELSTSLSNDFDQFMRAFEAHKTENDRRLAEIERRATDPLTTEKLARIDRSLDELALKMQRPHLATSQTSNTPLSTVAREHKSAFHSYIRKGEIHTLSALEAKALNATSDPDGGYLVPDETEAMVNASLRAISPIRAIAGIRQVSGSIYKKPFSTTGFGNGWVGDTAVRPETATPVLAELSFPTMELYAMPAATSSLLDDSAVNIDQWIAEEVNAAFAEQEGRAFVIGNGVNKPKGFLDYPKVANATWSHGNVGTISTGVAGAFPATNGADKLLDLVYAVKAGYRANGTFVMNRATQAAVRKLKDSSGHYLWAPAGKPGEAPTLMGFPVTEAEDMPDIATDSHAVAFGDFKRGYLIVDRVGIRVLRDPYSSKPYVLFYTTKRVGGGIQDFDAIKLLKFGV
jgi:HK97 family phage major capsid protein